MLKLLDEMRHTPGTSCARPLSDEVRSDLRVKLSPSGKPRDQHSKCFAGKALVMLTPDWKGGQRFPAAFVLSDERAFDRARVRMDATKDSERLLKL
jgi:hypothetical protein